MSIWFCHVVLFANNDSANALNKLMPIKLSEIAVCYETIKMISIASGGECVAVAT